MNKSFTKGSHLGGCGVHWDSACTCERLRWRAIRVGDWVYMAKKDRSMGNQPFYRSGTVDQIEEAKPPHIPRKVFVHGHMCDENTYELRGHHPDEKAQKERTITAMQLSAEQAEEEREVRRMMDLEAIAEDEV